MARLETRLLFLTLLFMGPSPVNAARLNELYTTKAIVTGTGEKNRQPGFRDCLDRVLVRVSGDHRLITRPAISDLRARAGSFVSAFSYRDRLAGKPIHDEQGTHDRPHDLTCVYEPAVIDGLLADLGSRPWLGRRPVAAIFLTVTRGDQHYRVDNRNPRDQAMREAFAQAASPLAMTIVFPSQQDWTAGAKTPQADWTLQKIGADISLIGSITWSDADLGWVASWHFAQGGQAHRWQVKGVNFDEAFRVAMRGVAQISSGNGEP